MADLVLYAGRLSFLGGLVIAGILLSRKILQFGHKPATPRVSEKVGG